MKKNIEKLTLSKFNNFTPLESTKIFLGGRLDSFACITTGGNSYNTYVMANGDHVSNPPDLRGDCSFT